VGPGGRCQLASTNAPIPAPSGPAHCLPPQSLRWCDLPRLRAGTDPASSLKQSDPSLIRPPDAGPGHAQRSNAGPCRRADDLVTKLPKRRAFARFRRAAVGRTISTVLGTFVAGHLVSDEFPDGPPRRGLHTVAPAAPAAYGTPGPRSLSGTPTTKHDTMSGMCGQRQASTSGGIRRLRATNGEHVDPSVLERYRKPSASK